MYNFLFPTSSYYLVSLHQKVHNISLNLERKLQYKFKYNIKIGSNIQHYIYYSLKYWYYIGFIPIIFMKRMKEKLSNISLLISSNYQNLDKLCSYNSKNNSTFIFRFEAKRMRYVNILFKNIICFLQYQNNITIHILNFCSTLKG